MGEQKIPDPNITVIASNVMDVQPVEEERVSKKEDVTISDDWMIEDVGTIESTDDESKNDDAQNKPLSLAQPLYSDIASKEAVSIIENEKQKTPDPIITIKGSHETLII